jgi:adenylate cyclase
MAKLIISTPGIPDQEVPLNVPLSMGRHPEQSLQILDRLVSKEHARIEKVGSEYLLTDLNSRNGTFVNGKMVREPHTLRTGDSIGIGATKITFEGDQRTEEEVELSDKTITSAVRSVLDYKSATNFLAAAEIKDEGALRRDYDRLRLAYLLHQELALELDLKIMLDKTFELIFQFIPGVGRGIVMLLNPAENRLEITKVKTKDPRDEKQKVVVSSTIVNQVLKDRRSVLSSDALVDDRFDQAKSIILQGIRSTMTVPLLSRGGAVLGILHMDSQSAAGIFNEQDLAVVQSLAGQVALQIENVFLARRIEADAETKHKLSRFLSPNLVEKVLNGQMVLEKGGEYKNVTIMFSDIRGFTTMSERRKPDEIVGLLNDYFESMVEIVFQHGGTLDKFMGDAIMALWGAPISTPDDPVMAVGAAVRMQRLLTSLNEKFKERFGEELAIGIGIDTGPVVAGLMGSSKTISYTVVGGYVNRASRLCSAASAGEVLISEDTFRLVEKHFLVKEKEPIKCKGIAELVRVYRVLDMV